MATDLRSSLRLGGRRPVWEAVAQPEQPQRRPRIVTVPEAYLSEVATGRLATVHRPDQWFRGAVYDRDDTLVRASQKVLGHPAGPRVAADPDQIVRRVGADLAGRWLYGGTWAPVFGHFLVETLTTLWPTDVAPPVGLVFHSNFGTQRIEDWHRRLIELAGWGGLPIHVVGTAEPAHVEELVVPSRSVALHAWAHPEAHDVWQRIAAGFRGAGGSDRVHISRTELNARRRADGHRRPIRTYRYSEPRVEPRSSGPVIRRLDTGAE